VDESADAYLSWNEYPHALVGSTYRSPIDTPRYGPDAFPPGVGAIRDSSLPCELTATSPILALDAVCDDLWLADNLRRQLGG
jgi:hypothetical protein